ncbi:MAG: 3-dehydroquinate synthase [Bacteroidetes bacterium]|nr:MAG: 3-dehydroquinate synthase [Bacteroidota bacterium]
MMENITLKTASAETKIFINLPFINFREEFLSFTQNGYFDNVVIVTDSNVRAIYGNYFSDYHVIEINPGEESKSLKNVENIYKQIFDYNIDRNGFILGIGGGVVCDITGYVASTYLRGVRFGFVATSLLAQVDASIGGKNGVNFLGYKNIIGTINQPEFVICDSEMLGTLQDKEFRCGLAEIVKSSLAGIKELFTFLENNIDSINKKEKSVLNKIISDTIKFKVSIVEHDEWDKGIRQILNLGHTFAHAIESKTGMSHGEAVSIGICKSAEVSVKLDFFSNMDLERIKSLLNKINLPTITNIDFTDVLTFIMKDKKRNSDYINYVLLKAIGAPLIHKFKIEELKELI